MNPCLRNFSRMECCCLVVILWIGVLFQSAIAFPFRSKQHYGSKHMSAICNCHSVEFWLRESGGLTTESPSFEVLHPTWERSQEFVAKSGKRLRLRPQKNCEFVLKKSNASGGLTSVDNENIEDGPVDVWLKDNSKCVSLWMKCQQRTVCVGADLLTNDFVQSNKRKLLMVDTSDSEEKADYKLYGILLSAFVLCTMLILVALCGSNERKYVMGNGSSSEVYTGGDGQVEIVSSHKIKSIPRENRLASDIRKEEKEKPVVTVDRVEDDAVTQDRNSNNGLRTANDHDLVTVNGDHYNPYSIVQDTADGQVFGKNKEIEKDKERGKDEEKISDKKADKKEITDTRPTRAHTAPEAKGFSKTRFSLKGHLRASSASASQNSVKKDKKKKKKKSQSDDELSPPSSPTSSSNFSKDRRSFIGRELPQRPSESDEATPTFDDNYAEPFDCKNGRPVTIDALEEDSNYETVENRVTSSKVVSKSGQAGLQRTEPEDDIVYDSVDEKKQTKSLNPINDTSVQSETFNDSEMYETVQDSTKCRQSELMKQYALYEPVESRNALDVYDEPNLTRQRSASDIVPASSTPATQIGQKSLSLERLMTPAPPLPLRDNQRVVSNRDSKSDEELIEPYTLTRKQGDFIFQETSTSLLPLSVKAKPQPPPLTPEELEKMYAKVDKKKKARDRMEMENQAKMEGSKKDEARGSVFEANAGDELSSEDPAVSGDDHDYELIPTLPRKTSDLKDDENIQLYDEVNVKTTSSTQ